MTKTLDSRKPKDNPEKRRPNAGAFDPAPELREQLLRVNQAAEFLNISPKTLWNWIYLRDLEVIRVGRSVRITPATIKGIIESGRVPARIA